MVWKSAQDGLVRPFPVFPPFSGPGFQASPHKIYSGFQRLFMRGFRFRAARVFGLGPKTSRPLADETPHRTREKTSGTQSTQDLGAG